LIVLKCLYFLIISKIQFLVSYKRIFSSKLQTLTVENDAVQEDRARVLQRYQELLETVQDLRNQNSQLCSQLQETKIEHREALRSQKLQAETLNQCYKVTLIK
jgi:cell shape-determining protein MreC